MIQFAIMKNSLVENVVVATNKEEAERHHPEHTVVEVPEGELVYIGGEIIDGMFTEPRPYPSWIWYPDFRDWFAPKPEPSIEDVPEGSEPIWNEDSQDWDIVEKQ